MNVTLKSMLPIQPNQKIRSARLEFLQSKTCPITKLDFEFEKIKLDDFLPFYRRFVISGRLIEYENYLFTKKDGEIFSNLNSNPYQYEFDKHGKVYFKRLNRFDQPQKELIDCVVYNQSVGFFPEIMHQYPQLQETLQNCIDKLKLDVFKISVVGIESYVPYHIDSDYYYAVRLNLNHSDFVFKFKEIPINQLNYFHDLFAYPEGRPYEDLLAQIKHFPVIAEIENHEVGNAFLINSFNYFHCFYPKTVTYIAAFYAQFR